MSKFALLFLLVFFSGIVAALTYSGAAAFVVYQLVYFINPDNRWWASSIPGLRYSALASLLMIYVLITKYKYYTQMSPWGQMPPLKWLFAVLCMYYVAYTFALDITNHKIYTFDFLKLVIIIFVAYKLIHSETVLRVCLWCYILGCTYIGYLAHVTGRNSQGRVEGIGMVDALDANDTAAALVPAAVLLMYFAWMGSMRVRVLAVLCGAVIANGLVLINSRGSFLGVVVSLAIFVFFMVFSSQQQRGQRATAVLMVALGVGGALYVTDDLFWERMGTLQNIENTETSGAGRMVFWWTTFDMLEDHPMGMGINGYNRLAPLYMDDETRGGVKYRSVHSTWFQGLSELGWIGFGFFCCMLASLYLMSRKAKRYVISTGDIKAYFQILALECSLLGYLAAGTFINRFRAEILYWMILFLAVAVKVFYLQKQACVEGRKPKQVRNRTITDRDAVI